jgi:hypothetical protein
MSKRPRSLPVPMAGGLLLAGIMSSCILPQNDDPLPEQPPERNNRPRIVLGSVFPGLNDVAPVVPLGCVTPPDFHAYVEDFDLEDPISSRWIASTVDPVAAPGVGVEGAQLGPSSTAQRPNPIKALRSAFSNMTAPNTYRFELRITDGTFFVDEGGRLGVRPPFRPFTPPDGGAADEAGVDSVVWIIQTVNGCPP